MKEIEVRFIVNSLRGIAPKLKRLGAHLVRQGIEESYYFDTPQYKLRKNGIALRLRRRGNNTNTLTLKKDIRERNKKYKVKKELEIEVDNIRTTKDILENIGLVECFKYKKDRVHWKLGNISIELDKLLKNKFFVEIEGSKQQINKLAKTLNLDWNQSTTKDYVEIVKKLRI